MKIESIVTIKKELKHLPKEELIELCLRLGKFKKENKAMLTYLLFQADDEQGYISAVQETVDELFDEMNTYSYFYMKKTIRKILKQIRQYIRFSKNKTTEVELLLYFCEKLLQLKPSIFNNTTLTNIYERQIESIQKKIGALHEDLQFDYNQRIVELESLE
ncbi:hypothetical protein [Brumimicrobium aurantiacum]|uniref:Uncharacterized protein n=1 Tax=Brumimicrobium aurantiacum TaxID=1737063 RepID=A0A3E1F0A0_9FLAO|nr:hypothetical protein [Brumimicrobium aurantiacum]RFC55228.1 hypothetical protein DXU93_05245 [Brumimicrobium aurantiacum]